MAIAFSVLRSIGLAALALSTTGASGHRVRPTHTIAPSVSRYDFGDTTKPTYVLWLWSAGPVNTWTFWIHAASGSSFSLPNGGAFAGYGGSDACIDEDNSQITGTLVNGQLKFHFAVERPTGSYGCGSAGYFIDGTGSEQGTASSSQYDFAGNDCEPGGCFQNMAGSIVPASCQPRLLADGAPTSVAILLDGAPSSEGTAGSGNSVYYPLPVANPNTGVPVVAGYCPVTAGSTIATWNGGPPNYENHPTFPPVLQDSLYRWGMFGYGDVCKNYGQWQNCLVGRLAPLCQ